MIQYPGAIVATDKDCVILGRTTGHEPDKIVSLVTMVDNKITNVYDVETETTKENVATQYTFAGDVVATNIPYSTALLMTSATIITSSGGIVNDPVIGEDLELFSVDAPRGFVRIDSLCATSINQGRVPLASRVECMTSAYQYYDVKIKSCIKGTFLDPKDANPDHYYVSAPENMYTEVLANTSIVWRVIF